MRLMMAMLLFTSVATGCAHEPPPLRPPTTTAPAAASKIELLAAQLNNSQITWDIWWWSDKDSPYPSNVDIGTTRDSSELYNEIMGAWRSDPNQSDDETARVLVKAMDDPTKIVAAHYALHRCSKHLDESQRRLSEVPELDRLSEVPTKPFLYNFVGLIVELTPDGTHSGGVAPGGFVDTYPCSARIDPGQFPSLRARWHQWLTHATHP